MMKQDEFPRPACLALRTPHARVSFRLDRRRPLVVAALLLGLLLAVVLCVS